jgi:hypothetical protein
MLPQHDILRLSNINSSVGDIAIVLSLARQLYRNCKSAGGEYIEISREVRGLHTVLRHLKYEVESPDSILNRPSSPYAADLAPIIGNCDATLRQLDSLIQKYCTINDSDGGVGRLWERFRFGTVEMDKLGEVRMKLMGHKSTITMFLDTVQLRESGRLAGVVEGQGGDLRRLLAKVDGIARRMGQQAGSTMTAYEDDDHEVWKSFRR